MSWDPIANIAEAVNSGGVSAVDNVKKALSKITEFSEYNSVISVLEKTALERAKLIDAKIASNNNAGRLAGVPFIAKDNFLVFGADTTAASNILKGFIAPYQATAIEKLEAEGAICVAKSNLDAFAHGGSTENSDFFVTKNARDKTRVAGGSSGGSAVAVALGIVPFALGTDTGGSIRQPASFNGVVGYKPTYGLVSRSGVIAMASSTDVIGPLTTSVEDASLVLDVISGKDELDSTMIDRDDSTYDVTKTDTPLKDVKIGVIKEYLSSGIDEDVKNAILEKIDVLRKQGAEIEEVSLPSLSLALAVYYVVIPAEISSNLSRYDGQRFGFSSTDARDITESYELSRSEGFGAEAKRRIMIGTHVLSSGYYDAYYKKAQTVRTKIINEFTEAFKKYDYLVGPVAPETAFKIGENSNDPLKMYLIDIMTVAVNLVGIPAISIPCGEAQKMPVGFQIMSQQKNDKKLLEIAKSMQEVFNGASA